MVIILLIILLDFKRTCLFFHEFKSSLTDSFFIQPIMSKDFMRISMNYIFIGNTDNTYRNRKSGKTRRAA